MTIELEVNKYGVTMPLGRAPQPPREIDLSENSRIVMEKRYVRKDANGDPAETIHDTFWRVASNVALAENEHNGDLEQWTHVFYNLLTDLRFLPNSPTFTGAGTPLGNLSACFVLPIEDDMGASDAGIFQTLRDAALIQQTGGGNGFSFSRLRSKGTRVKSSNGQASGPIGFLKAYDQSFGIVNQGGARRGANMGVLRVDHPDVREFITCKTDETHVTNFNISVAITDKFMQAVAEDGDFELVEPSNGQVVETLRARELFDLIAKHAHHNGEPGVLFIDQANRSNPIPHVGTYEATNPCVTGDTRLYTNQGMVKAIDLFNDETEIEAVIDGRFGLESSTTPTTRVFRTGHKPVFRLQTKEGYFVRATDDHRFMTPQGWVELKDLNPGDSIHILNRKGGFGPEGSLELGRELGVQIAQASVTSEAVAVSGSTATLQTVSIAADIVPEVVFRGTEAMQRGFLESVFATAGNFQDDSVQLTHPGAEAMQMLLQNFGIKSYRRADELTISGDNFVVFCDEIGFDSPAQRGPYREYFTATVEAIIPDGTEDVFDITEPITHSMVVNGIVTHQCGEQWLLGYESCNLGSVNLARHVKDGAVDWEQLQQTIEEATRFLDDVITANRYVDAVPQLRQAALRSRRIGLGFMGLADMMVKLNLRYGSPEGQEFAAQIAEFVRYHAMLTSVELAKERGSFLGIMGSVYDPANMTWEPPKPIAPYSRDWGRPTVDWQKVVGGIKSHGIRNAAQTTIAPTGTIATVSGCEGYGCEPIFALAYTRYVVDGDKRLELDYASPLLEDALHRAGLEGETMRQVISRVSSEGTCNGITEIPSEIRNALVVSSDITPDEHVRMQASIQAFIDNSISKTINMPAEATTEDVKHAYQLAWELGCKGLTVYVTGSRDVVVLETKATREAREKGGEGEKTQSAPQQKPMLYNERKKPRPTTLNGKTYRSPTPAGTAYITVNENGHGHGQPFEVFINTSKAGSEIAAISEAMGRLVSLILRQGSPIPPRDRVREIVRQLENIGGGRQMGFGPNRVTSLPDAIAQTLHLYLQQTADADEKTISNGHSEQSTIEVLGEQNVKMPIGDICPECGSATLILREGCVSCHNCGYSEC